MHPLAAAKGENNAVLIRGRAVGEMLFAGKGAGSLPTAAAVLSDVIEMAGSRAAVPAAGGAASRRPAGEDAGATSLI